MKFDQYRLSVTSFFATVRNAAKWTVSVLSSPTIAATLFLISASPGTTPAIQKLAYTLKIKKKYNVNNFYKLFIDLMTHYDNIFVIIFIVIEI